jgi:hypothetical protein
MQSFHLQGFEVKRIRKDLKIGRMQHTYELLHPLDKLGDLFLISG